MSGFKGGFLSPLEQIVEKDLLDEGLGCSDSGIKEFWARRIEWFGMPINQQWAYRLLRLFTGGVECVE